MLKKLFSGMAKPKIDYIPFQSKLPAPLRIKLPESVTLILADTIDEKEQNLIKPGDAVKTGQKLSLSEERSAYVISPVSGTIATVAPFTGDSGQTGTAISIKTAAKEELDDQFAGAIQDPSLASAAGFLGCAPGKPSFGAFTDAEKSIHTIVINASDPDLLVATNQFVVQTDMDAITKGISVLKKITGIENVIIVVPVNIMSGYGEIGAEVKFVSTTYPSALPPMILKDILGQELPAAKTPEDIGISFFSAEAIASIGHAYENGRIPSEKILTVVKKDGSIGMVSAVIGTPIKYILHAVGQKAGEMDRVVLGGPMMGTAIYTLDYPVRPDTDAVMIQDKDSVPFVSDYPCINCGECIRICPARIPVNMLVRFLEAGQFQEAADLYDLFSCFECGLCSYVCVSRIPIFQYIRLAKYELGRLDTAEVTNA